MLARFENGYYLEVLHNEKENEYNFTVYDAYMFPEHKGWTEYRSIDMYYPMNEIDYILEYCEPDFVDGEYKIFECSLEEFRAQNKYDFENDTEDILIQKALNKNELYVCIADQEFVIYVISDSEFKADEYAYNYYCEECFEPGHWKCFREKEDDLDDYDVLLYDEDDFYDGELI